MDNTRSISGFSKLSKRGKIKWLVENFFKDRESVKRELMSYWLTNEDQQKILDGFSENTITNFAMPYGVAPNFLINGKTYCVPMVIEESSVVAAAANAAKIWMKRGGFKTEVLGTEKIGQVHFLWKGDPSKLLNAFERIKLDLLQEAEAITANMVKRGGGIKDVVLIDLSQEMDELFQLKASFETCDSMGANFINSVLELFSSRLKALAADGELFGGETQKIELIMSILSNYTPDCLVRAELSCPIKDLAGVAKGMSGQDFAHRFHAAVQIAGIDSYRATTHNKGIFNGIDAVVLATGNDFRAIEACGHTYASKDGRYTSLSHCELKEGIFRFWLDIPLAIGTVGGLTSLHPMAKRSLELLGNPNAEELMQIIAATGLAQNFAAVKSLVTVGIQQGHMKMHLMNILHQLEATEKEMKTAAAYFSDKIISFASVRQFLDDLRTDQTIVA